MKNENDDRQSLFVGKGVVVEARYISPELPKFSNNPCILALPCINTRKQALADMQRFPKYDRDPRKLPAHLRTHTVMDLLHFFQPLPVHLKLEGMVSRMIRDSYLARNPIDPAYRGNLKERLECFKESRHLDKQYETTASGFSIIGMSGVGKSTGMKRVLSLYPQIIIHNHFQSRNFTAVQIVWLKLECPKEASLTSLCVDFFKSIDDLLGTNYARDYGKRGRNIQELTLFMAIVAAEHYIGVIVIDELQDLSVAKSGGAAQVLNFFVKLVNTIGLPIILIGTYKAIPILSSEFRLAQRGSGQGDLVWDRMSFDEDWQIFVEELWDLRYVKKECVLTPELSKTLHELSYGIMDLAIRIYMAAQVRAIETRREKITEELLRSAYRDDFRLVSRILETLKSGDISSIHNLEDVLPPAIQSIHQLKNGEDNNGYNERNSDLVSQGQKPPPNSDSSKLQAPPIDQTPNVPAINGRDDIGLIKINKSKSSKRIRQSVLEQGDLRRIVADGKNATPPKSAYQSLLQEGYIRVASEYLGE